MVTWIAVGIAYFGTVICLCSIAGATRRRQDRRLSENLARTPRLEPSTVRSFASPLGSQPAFLSDTEQIQAQQSL